MRAQASMLVGLAVCGCTPDFSDDSTRIIEPRLIAIVAEPPEVRPGDDLQLTAVVAGGNLELTYRFCTVSPSPTDPRPVAEACLSEAGLPLAPRGISGARGRVPANACSLFGPNPTAAQLRAPDADATGGYYQPVVIEGLSPSVGLVRILCPLPDVPTELAGALTARYQANQNPEISGIEPEEPRLRAGASQPLRVTLPAGAAETFWWIPPGAGTLAEQRESLRVSWFALGASWASSATGADTSETPSSAQNTLTPDVGATSVEVWAVLRDSRGGQSAQHWQLQVAP